MRIEYIKGRLMNWARYRASEHAGGVGYASRSAYCFEHVSRAGYRDARIPIIETDAVEMQAAIDAMGAVHADLKRTLEMVYLKFMSYSDVARSLGCVTSTVMNHLSRSDAWLDQWLRDKANRAANERQRKSNCLL